MTRLEAACLVLLLGATLAWAQGGRPPSGAPAAPGMGVRSEGTGAEAQPPWLRVYLGRVNAAQRQLNQALSRELRRLRQGEVAGAGLAVAWIAFLYGVLHAVGPGHGKLVVSSLFLAREARLGTAVAVSGAVSLLQTVSAIAVVSVVALALGRGGLDVLRDSRRVELISYGLIATIGLVMLAAAIRELWTHGHGLMEPAAPGYRPARTGRARGRVSGLVLATGLTPCASAIIIMLFALGQGVFLVGIAATLVMAVGMGLTVSLVGILAVLARRGTLRAVSPSRGAARWVGGTLGVLGAAAIASLGLVLFLGAWASA
jgi:ABC-type nickel/cobalt efflux system permease component RcnA